MTKSETRRHANIRSTVAAQLDTNHLVRSDATRDDVAVAIRALTDLGRTGRWINAIDTWACMVLDEDNDLHWALLQGSVGATHAA